MMPFSMYLQKTSSLLLTAALLGGSLMSFFVLPAPTQAQTDSTEVVQCTVIDGLIEYSLPPGEGEVRIDGQLSIELKLSNTSSYIYPGVRVGIALFESEQDTLPAYWVLDDEEYQIAPQQAVVALIDADVSSVPVGSYFARPFVGQGDDLHMLGIAIRNGVDGDGFEMERTGVLSQPITHTIEINDGAVTSGSVVDEIQFIEVVATTKNFADTPLVNTEAVVGVIQGDVPLGDAVREQRIDGVKLIPGAERETTIGDVSPEGGQYSVVSGVKRENAFGPVELVSFQIGEDVPNQSWPYLSRVALSGSDNEVVACVDYIGEYTGAIDLLDVVEVELVLSNSSDDSVVYEATATNGEGGVGNALRFNPDVNVIDTELSLTLLTERFPSNLPEPSQTPAGEELIEPELYPVQTVESNVSCSDEIGCGQSEEEVTSLSTKGSMSDTNQNEFWFYAGVMLAAALLMYIVLRRLHPEEKVKPKTEQGEDMHMPE